MREANSTFPRNIGTNSMKDSIQKLLETYFLSFLLMTGALSKTEGSVNLGFFPKNKENNAFFSTEAGLVDAL